MTRPRPAANPLDVIARLDPEFLGESWRGWRSVTAALFGLPPEDPIFVERVTGRSVLPTRPVTRGYLIVARGGGKSRSMMRLGAYMGTRKYMRAPGEKIYIIIVTPTRQQSAVNMAYLSGLLHTTPALERLIVRETQSLIELSTGVVFEVLTPDHAHLRGRAIACAIVDESEFLPTDDSANPASELIVALGPALARVPGSMLLVISSPYAQQGVLYDAHREYFGKDDPDTLVVQADTLSLNPAFDHAAIARAYREDPERAAAEYGGQFRSDRERLFTREAVEACVVPGRFEVPPSTALTYDGVIDFSGGSGTDSATLRIGHREVRGAHTVLVEDCGREIRPPFSPEAVAREFAGVLKAYRVVRVISDKFAGLWPIEEMARHGILVEPSARPKSELYAELLPVINTGRVELLDHARTVAQLCALERRTGRGRDSIDHPPNAHDDCCNATALLAAATAGAGPPPLPATMTGCNRRQSNVRTDLCYLWSRPGEWGAYVPSADASCRACLGHRAVVDAWKADPRGLDLRNFRWQCAGSNPFIDQMREDRAHEEVERWAGTML